MFLLAVFNPLKPEKHVCHFRFQHFDYSKIAGMQSSQSVTSSLYRTSAILEHFGVLSYTRTCRFEDLQVKIKMQLGFCKVTHARSELLLTSVFIDSYLPYSGKRMHENVMLLLILISN